MAGNYGYGYDPYNPANPYGYPGPYSAPYPTRYTSTLPTQQMPQNVQQNAPQQQSNVPWIQVPNIEAARNVMVQPNQTAYLMNQNAPEFYVKSTDAMGVATLRSFKFQEFDPTQEAAKEVLNSQAGNLVSREEFNNFANQVSAQFNAIQQNMTAPAPVAQVQTVQPAQQVVQQPVQQVAQPVMQQAVQQVQLEQPVAPAPVASVPSVPMVRGTAKKRETDA